MNFDRQVDYSHYEFSSYMKKERWVSLWHQLDEIVKYKPKSVLEIGPGLGLFKLIAARIGIDVDTFDFAVELRPDFIGDVTSMDFADNSYDVVCAFQMLEHLPYQMSLKAFSEMVRVSRRGVLISLPDSKRTYRMCAHLPRFGEINFFITKPTFSPAKHVFDGEHYWEVNKSGYELAKIIADFSRFAHLDNTYRVSENMYHRFFIFNKNS